MSCLQDFPFVFCSFTGMHLDIHFLLFILRLQCAPSVWALVFVEVFMEKFEPSSLWILPHAHFLHFPSFGSHCFFSFLPVKPLSIDLRFFTACQWCRIYFHMFIIHLNFSFLHFLFISTTHFSSVFLSQFLEAMYCFRNVNPVLYPCYICANITLWFLSIWMRSFTKRKFLVII